MKQSRKTDLIAAIDLGSSYTKIVYGNLSGKIKESFLCSSSFEIEKILNNRKMKNLRFVSATGHLKNLIATEYHYSEARALCYAFNLLNEKNGTLIDFGGQDLKIFTFKDGRNLNSKINRRCSAGTGSFLDFISFKLSLKKEELNKLAGKTKKYYPINNYCTVFASFEIIEMLNKKIKKEEIIRGIFHSMAMRIYELGPFEEPVFFSGGVVEHYPVFYEILGEVLKLKIKKIEDPQFFQAKGAFFLLKDELKNNKL